MSRTNKGSKGPGYDYSKKRKGNESQCAGFGPKIKKCTNKSERRQNKLKIIRNTQNQNDEC